MKRKGLSFIMVLIMVASLFAGFNFGTKTAQAEDGLVLHLTFDDNLNDASGTGNDGECSYGKISYKDGIYGKAAVFNGKSYIEIQDSDSLDIKNFTISLWAYKEKNFVTDKLVPYIYKEEDADCWRSPYEIYEMQDNLPYIRLHDTADESEMDQFDERFRSVDVRKWFLMTATYNGKEVRLYEDGVLVKKTSVTGSPTATVGNLYIGMKDGEYFFNGMMDDLKIYNKALSAGEVQGIYDKGLAAKPEFLTQKDALVAYYKFNGDFKDSSSFGNDAEKVTGKVSFVEGKNGKAAKFSDNTYLEVLNNPSLEFDQGFTMSAWVVNNKAGKEMSLISMPGPSTTSMSNEVGYRFFLYEDYYDFTYVPFGEQNWNERVSYYTDKNVNKWNHVVITFDTEKICWYINGKLVDKTEVPAHEGSHMAHCNGNLMIGSDGEYFFQGTVDELKLYNYALSQKEVEKDYKNVDSISISSDNTKKIKSLKAKDKVTLVVTRKYIETGKSVKLSPEMTYKSSNSKVFKVSKTGIITAVKKGSANLTITHGGISRTYKVTVK